MPQVVVEKVTKTYCVDKTRITAANNVSLILEKGEFASVTGHSGSGKTTLLSILGGLTRPTSGVVTFEGTDIYSLDTDGLAEFRAERIGFIFQTATLLPMLTVRENLLLPSLFHPAGTPDAKAEQFARELLGLVGLDDRAEAYPYQLSGGQQRRVAIARAFMNDPALILADEPTGDLDEETEAAMMRFFRRMNKERGLTFLIVTHSRQIAMQTGRQLRMRNGVLLGLGESYQFAAGLKHVAS